MDVKTQDAVERLMRGGDFQLVLDYIAERRNVYMEFLSMAAPDAVYSMAKAQGEIQGLGEVLRIPDEAKSLKKQRTENG